MGEPLHRAEKISKDSSNGLLLRHDGQTSSNNVAAIDFGTTFCSLAYSIGPGDTTSLLTFDGDCHERVPNSVLIKEEDGICRVDEFGYRAHENYTKLRPSEKLQYIYFARIKPLLWEDERLHRESIVESFNKKKFYLIEVIAFILSYLKKRFEEHIGHSSMSHLKALDFEWVITVPAIWKARGKRMMREAAYMAGLLSDGMPISSLSEIGRPLQRPNEIDSQRLSLALEPESAAIYCQLKSKPTPSSHSKCIIADIGGGTIDITAHCMNEGQLDVLVTPLGSMCGGTFINKEFAKFFASIVDDENFKSFLNCDDYLKSVTNNAIYNGFIYSNFEQQKIIFGESVSSGQSCKDSSGFDKECIIPIPRAIVKHYGEDRIRVGIDSLPGVHYCEDELYIAYYQMANIIFKPTIERLLDSIVSVLVKLHDIRTLYLVGGFGGCQYVHYKVREYIMKYYPSPEYQIIVPTSPNVAVAKGAVLWKKHHEVIKSRCSDATYGIGVTIPFNPLEHNPFYKDVHPETGELRCRNVFSVFAQVGEVVYSNVVFQTGVIPHRSTHDFVNVSIYCTDKLGVQYIKDENGVLTVRKIGELLVNISSSDKFSREERKVLVVLDFSGTEIHARARYSITGEEFETVCDFLTAVKCV